MNTILLVEADLHQKQLYCEELQDQGWQVICVASAPEALEAATTNPIDCVVLDAKLPQLDSGGEFPALHQDGDDDGENGNGTQLLSQFRQHWPQLPVVIYTTQAAAERGHSQHSLSLRGAHACVLKNGDPSHLVTAVYAALQKASDQRVATQQAHQLLSSPNDTNCGRNGAPEAATLDTFVPLHHDTRVDPYQDSDYNAPR